MWGDLILNEKGEYFGIIPRGSVACLREGDSITTNGRGSLPAGIEGKILGILGTGNLRDGGSPKIVVIKLNGAKEPILVSPFTITAN
jgi:hypothetical protein